MLGKTVTILAALMLMVPDIGLGAASRKTPKNGPGYVPAYEDSLVFDRGIDGPASLFIPKGTLGAGVSFSYSTYDAGSSAGDDNGFAYLASLVKGVKGTFSTFSISPHVSWFFKENLSVGGRFEYGKTMLELNSLSLNLSEDLNFDINDFNFNQNDFSLAVTLRNYMPIADSKRFALFIEGRLAGTYGEQKNYKVEEGLKHGIFQQTYKGSVTIVPGVCVFITNDVAFEVQVGVMGLNYQKIKQTEDKIHHSSVVSSGANFKINLLSLSFGTSFYILNAKRRPRK